MRRRKQEQTGGAGATNLQAGRDIVHSGVTASESREIALDVYKANSLELGGVAAAIAFSRVEKLTRDLFERLERDPQLLSSMQDPDMLGVVFTAQAGFARSGEEDLEAALVDLLVDRAAQQERDLKTLVLNEAIETLPKLSSVQRRSLAVCFLFRHTSPGELDSIDAYYSRISEWKPAFNIGSLIRADLQYLAAAAAGSMNVTSIPLGLALATNARGFYTKGFSVDDIPPVLRAFSDDQEVFIPCLRDPHKLQVNAIGAREVAAIEAKRSIEQNILANFAHVGVMSPDDIEVELVERVPEAAVLAERWEKSGLESFDLTAAGLAIGHAYWKQVVPPDASAPLDIWLSE
jgi:hypothetical protein